MKQTLKAAGGLLILTHIAIGILLVTITSCGETEDPLEPTEMVKSGTDVELFGATKKAPDAAPAAPTMQMPEGTPTVKEVGYYADWQLTEELSGTVAPGKTIFIKIVFSEPMKFKPADDNTAFPILYYRVGNKQHRFKVAKHGASGEDFVSGDAKPLGSGTDDYICKYIVPTDATAKFRVEIGKFNADLDGNNLPAFYTHTEELQLGKAAEKPTEPEKTMVETPDEPTQPEPPTKPTDTAPPTVVSVTHYINGVAIEDGATVPVSTVDTQVVFSEPVMPVITYTTGGRTRKFTTSDQIGGIHWRGICKPADATGTIWLCKQNTVAPSFVVTVTTDTVDRGGNRLVEAAATTLSVEPRPVVVVQPTKPEPATPDRTAIDRTDAQPVPGADNFTGTVYTPNPRNEEDAYRSRALPVSGAIVTIASGNRSGEQSVTNTSGKYTFLGVAESRLHLRVEKGGFETKEVIVHRTAPTTLADGTEILYKKDPQRSAGNILIGHSIPSSVRTILQKIDMMPDILYVNSGSHAPRHVGKGAYMNGVAVVQHGNPHVIAHEFFHAHQHKLGLYFLEGLWNYVGGSWPDTPEGVAYAQARKKDIAEAGEQSFDRNYKGFDPETSAETFAVWWTDSKRLQRIAPNRYNWAEKWFGHIR